MSPRERPRHLLTAVLLLSLIPFMLSFHGLLVQRVSASAFGPTWDSAGLWNLNNVDNSTMVFMSNTTARFSNFQYNWPPAVSLLSKDSWTVQSRLVLQERLRAWNFSNFDGGFGWQTALGWGSGSAVMGYGRADNHNPNTGVVVGGECTETTPGANLATNNYLGQWLTINITLFAPTQRMYFAVSDANGNTLGQLSSPGYCGSMFGSNPVNILFFTSFGIADVDWIRVTNGNDVVLFDDFMNGQPRLLVSDNPSYSWTFDNSNTTGWTPVIGWNTATGAPTYPQSCQVIVGEYSLTTCDSLYRSRTFSDFTAEAQVRLVSDSSHSIWGIPFRINPASPNYASIVATTGDPYTLFQGYLFEFVGTSLDLFVCQNGGCTILASASPSVNAYGEHTLRVTAIGPNIDGFLDGQLEVSVQDSTFLTGLVGVRVVPNGCSSTGCASVTGEFDNVAILPISSRASCAASPSGLVSWWSAESNAADIVERNNGVPINGVTFGPGMVGQALVLNGLNQYIQVGDSQSLKISSGITLDAWVKPSTAPPSDDPSLSQIYAVVTKWGQSSTTDAYGMWLQNPDGNVRLVGGIGIPGVSDHGLRYGGIIPVGQWTHVAMTYDSASGINVLYVNGVQAAQRYWPGGITVSDLNVQIGKEDSFLPRYFGGSIDEVDVFGRALSQAEVQSIFAAGSAGKCPPPTPPPPFTKYAGNPVLPNGPAGSWDGVNVAHPFVLYDGSTYKMWYAGYSSTTGPAIGIGLATSPDGITWTKYSGNPVLTAGPSGSWDSAGVGPVSVLYDGTMYKMWYSGATGNDIQEWIGLATSTDGVHWTKYSGNPVLSSTPWTSTLKHPYVVLVNGTYWMYFAGFANCGLSDGYIHFCIGLAKSSDGISWNSLPNPVLVPSPAGWDSEHLSRPAVLFQQGRWSMWYTGSPFGTSQIGYALSSDGIRWTKFSGGPVIPPGAVGSWDSDGVSAGTVLFDGSTYKMWYSGADTLIGGVADQVTHFQIGLATSPALPHHRPPVASFTMSANSALTSVPIYFDGSSSYALNGTIMHYEWDFGNSAKDEGCCEVTTNWSFNHAGNYTVTLIVTDNNGLTNSLSKIVSIIDRPPTVTLSLDSTTVLIGQKVTASISAYDSDGAVSTLNIDWGDGVKDGKVWSPPQPNITATDVHSYSTSGNYTIQVIATDDSGSTRAGTANITVLPERISLTEFFTDGGSSALLTDLNGNPKIDVVLSNGKVTSTNPGQVLAWLNMTNTGQVSLDSVKLTETLPNDWDAHPPWLPARGAIHVYFVYTNGTRVEITDPNAIAISTSNPEILTINISDLNSTLVKSPLRPGESILASVQLSYKLIGTSQSFASYPRTYSDTSNATAWMQLSYTGSQTSASGSTSLVAYAKVVGDVNGDGRVDIIDAGMMVYAFGGHRGDSRYNTNLDFDGDGYIGITDVSIVFYNYGNHS